MHVAIVGAGIVGRLLAWHLCQRKIQVHLFDRDSIEEGNGCSWIAAGMISPIAEHSILSSYWYQMGLESLSLWPKILTSLPLPVFYHHGTLMVCALSQKALLEYFLNSLRERQLWVPSILNSDKLREYESSLNSFIGCYLPNEACINPSSLFKGLAHYLLNKGVKWYAHYNVKFLSQKIIETDKGQFKVDKIIDCRGLGARELLPELREVRGEILFCQSETIKLKHAIRLLHARFPCYIAPQGKGIYAIGATQYETEDNKGVMIQSALELLSAAVTVHHQFREAHILALKSHLRPTMPSHMPIVIEKDGITHINGMFRHGFLLAPALTAEIALNLEG